MIDYSKLSEYRPGIRPVGTESLPAHIDRELGRLRTLHAETLKALRDLDARLATLEP